MLSLAFDTEGYRQIFLAAKNAANQPLLQDEIKHFRDSPLYRFMVPTIGQHCPDHEALGIAVVHAPEFVAACVAKPKPALGYTDPAAVCPLDMIDCRHIMMIAIIKRWLPSTLKSLRVVEIGGGFGNWVRLCEGQIDYQTWTIIDMPFVTQVQEWYLAQTLATVAPIVLVDTDHYARWDQPQHFDLAIGAHSMSEFAFHDFDDYFDNIVLQSRYFFYATHLSWPDPGMVSNKLAKIHQHFDCIAAVQSERHTVGNYLFSNKMM